MRSPRLLFIAVLGVLAIALSGCGAGAGTTAVGSPIARWSQADSPNAHRDAVRDAAPEKPLLLRTQAEWDAWIASLPELLQERGFDRKPDFAAEVAAVGSYPDCESSARFEDAGAGALRFVVESPDDIACYWSPIVITVVTITVADTSAASADELTFTP